MMDTELRDALRDINTKLDGLATVRAQVDMIGTEFAKHVNDDRIFFLGTDSKVGLVVAVDRLQVSWAAHQKLFWVVVTAVAGLGVEAVWKLLQGVVVK